MVLFFMDFQEKVKGSCKFLYMDVHSIYLSPAELKTLRLENWQPFKFDKIAAATATAAPMLSNT